MTDQPQPEQQPSPAQYYPSAPPPPPEAPAGVPHYPQGYPQPGYPQPPQPGNTNGFAIAALVLGILPTIITNILAVIFGFLSLNQLKRRPQDTGKGMAIAGLVVGLVWLLVFTLGVIGSINNRAKRDEAGQVSQAGRLSVFDMKAGDCFDGIKEDKSITSVTAQPCASPHEAEVIDRWSMPGPAAYPGEQKVTSEVEEECGNRMSAALTEAELAKVETYYFYPTASSWIRGDRAAVCVAAAEKGQKLTQKLPRR